MAEVGTNSVRYLCNTQNNLYSDEWKDENEKYIKVYLYDIWITYK